MNSLVLLNKPIDISSFQFINKFKKQNLYQRIGHTGTLDPFASGLLVCGIDQGLKFLSFLNNSYKEYIFELTFGKATDTDDCTGNVVFENGNLPKNILEIQNVLSDFVGVITQIPSRFSAIKINGIKAYHLARKHEEFDMPKREITIYDLSILSCIECENGIQSVQMQVKTTPGAYIRTLGKDIASALNTCGYLTKLHRKSRNDFQNTREVEYVSLNYLNKLYPNIVCSTREIQQLQNGYQICFNKKDGLYAINDSDLNFFGIILINNSTTFIKRMLT